MVTVRSKALGDRRLVRLAQLAQYPGGDDEALGKMTRLWALCAEQQTNTPEVRHIRACLGPRGEEHLVESGLGDDKHRDPSLAEGVIRVRGCDQSDWHHARLEQQARAEAGRARAALASRDAAGRMLPMQTAGPPGSVQQDSSITPASRASDHSPDLISDPASLKLPDSGESVSAEREKQVSAADLVVARQAARTKHDRRARLFNDAWGYAGFKHAELQAAGVDPHARSCWNGLPSASSDEARALFARIDELTEGEKPDWSRAMETIKNRVDVAAAEARRDAKAGQRAALRWFIPARMWDAKSFSIAKDMSPEQAAQPRRADKPAAPEQPIRRMKTF